MECNGAMEVKKRMQAHGMQAVRRLDMANTKQQCAELTCLVAYSSARMLYEITRNLDPGVDMGLAAGSTRSRLLQQAAVQSELVD